MKSTGYSRSLRDSCVYFKKTSEEERTFLLLYVDDMLIISKNKETVKELKERLSSEFEMKDLGPARKILGMEITRNREENILELSQRSYLQKVLKTFRMDECKPVKTPLAPHMKFVAATETEAEEQADQMKSIPYANAVGSIMYSMIGSRPDLAHPVGVISRFMSKPLMNHWLGVKWVLRYIKGSIDSRLQYKKEGDFVVTGYCDSDHSGDRDRSRSTTGQLLHCHQQRLSI
ncbi:putative RNA-directed DNA polymerase [Arabidopsis thaliana]